MSQNRVSVYAVPGEIQNPSGGSIQTEGNYSVSWNSDGITGRGWTTSALTLNGLGGPNITVVEGDDIFSEAFEKKVQEAILATPDYNRWLAYAAYGESLGGDGLSSCVSG